MRNKEERTQDIHARACDLYERFMTNDNYEGCAFVLETLVNNNNGNTQSQSLENEGSGQIPDEERPDRD